MVVAVVVVVFLVLCLFLLSLLACELTQLLLVLAHSRFGTSDYPRKCWNLWKFEIALKVPLAG